MVFKTQLRLIF